MKKVKEYDAVAEVRKIRDEMSLKYWNNPELMAHDLKEASERFEKRMAALSEAKLETARTTTIPATKIIKEYDAVAEVRKIRDEWGLKYYNDRELLRRHLKEAHERFQQWAESVRAEKKQS
ncbi:hypothetical protein [Chitinophaga vietnamensis]|uniref:hypothetical protein n=1 Tax=Chitinophaga vietnamensis TaxID=2593957 RepID=UPI001177EC99|nr:hypothetical protein [Chitinophaga vietnamensis]